MKKLVHRCSAGAQAFWIVLMALLVVPSTALAHGGHGPTAIQTRTYADMGYGFDETVLLRVWYWL